jgi:hypothetical protein
MPRQRECQPVLREEVLMTRRSKIWLVVAVLFGIANLAGAGFAAAQGEVHHAATHIGLALLGAYAVWWLAPRRDSLGHGRRREAVSAATPGDLSDRLTHLEHAVDAVAIEIERIGEGQRSITRSLVENASQQPPGKGDAEPSMGKPRDMAPRERRD